MYCELTRLQILHFVGIDMFANNLVVVMFVMSKPNLHVRRECTADYFLFFPETGKQVI